jgi:hypothetical protein
MLNSLEICLSTSINKSNISKAANQEFLMFFLKKLSDQNEDFFLFRGTSGVSCPVDTFPGAA